MPEPLRWDMTLPNGETLRWDMGPDFTWDGNVPEQLYSPKRMQQNLISKTITPAAHTAILDKINELRVLVEAQCVVVPNDMRDELFRLGDARRMYDEKCDDYMHQQPATRPAEIDLAEYDRDGTVYKCCNGWMAALKPIVALIEGSQALSGSDRMSADLMYTSYLKVGKRIGIPNAEAIYQDIMQHYPGGGRRGGGTTPPPTP
jgi:hypothetical protein